MRNQPSESEKHRAERGFGFDDVVGGAELEGSHREVFVPVGHDHDGNVELSRVHPAQDGKSVHTRMAVLDEQDLEGRRSA